jgi:crotonobetainyl-CoA:carnitine CoA-transferase CaiB-like acyl-CoA transferase
LKVLFHHPDRGKKASLSISRTPRSAICLDLVKKADVLVENMSPGTMDKLGLGSQELCALNPSLIYASISAFGHTGPYRDYPAFDPIAQAMGGMTAVNGFPDQPVRCGVSIADFTSGLFAALAIMAAITHRLKTGEGQVIDLSMQESIWQLTSIEYSSYPFLNGRNLACSNGIPP